MTLLRAVSCRLWLLAVLSGFMLLSGCRSTPGTHASAAPAGTGLSLYEDRLLQAIERMQALEAYAEEAGDRQWPDVQRRFHQLAATFQALVADNPEQIEARLIYGKFLDFFGDHDGARDQFVEVLRRDPTVAVAHQQLGTYFAEHGDYGRAMAYYLAAVEHAPDEAFYHFGLGELLHAYAGELREEARLQESVREAQMVRAFGKAAELAPQNPVYSFRYGEALMNIAEPDWGAALAHWQRFAERDSLNALQEQTIRLHAAHCLAELGRYDEAQALAESVAHEDLGEPRAALLDAIAEARG